MKNKITKTILLSAALLLGIFCNTQAQSNIARLIQDGYKMYPYDSPSIAINTLQKYLEESFTTLVFLVVYRAIQHSIRIIILWIKSVPELFL